MRRFVVRPCDNDGTVEGLERDRTWLVWDRCEQRYVSEHLTRKRAYEAARSENAAAFLHDLAACDV